MELKPAIKKVARPAAKLVTSVVTRAIGPRLSALEHAHGDTAADVSKLKAYVPAVFDAVSSQHAIARAAVRAERDLWRQAEEHNRRMAEIERRTEFVRREMLFEFRYGVGRAGAGAGLAGSGDAPSIEPKVLNEEKLRAFGTDIRLNLGAGHIPLDDFLNVDAREVEGIDIVADIRALPFEAGEVATIYCAHLLEHFPLEEVRRSLLPYWLSLLQPGGRFIAVVPDSESMLKGYAGGEISFADLREVTFGGQEYEGDFHFNMYSQESLTSLLAEVGFVGAEITASGRRNGLCYEMQVEGRRPDPSRATSPAG
jgi:SAM-dependent methyltransferase